MSRIDKQLHFFSGGLIAGVAFAVVGLWWSLAAVAVIASVKEGYDYLHRDKHTTDPLDALATVAGWVPLALTVRALELIAIYAPSI